MKIKKYKEEWINIIRQNFIFLFLLLLLSGVNFFLAVNLVNAANNKLVILVPPKINDKTSFSGSTPSVSYLRGMGFYAVSLISSYTPETIRTQFDYFLSMVPASYFHKVKEKLDKIRKEEIKYSVSQEFSTSGDIKVYKDKIVLVGVLRRYLSSKLIDTIPIKYTIYYKIDKTGKFEVLGYAAKKI